MAARLFLFFLINFGGLALGGFFTGKGVPSDWYTNLNKAPWTPPGWVFGTAWTIIMICFSFYMAKLWILTTNKKLLIALFVFQWILNFGWNPVFFFHKDVLGGLVIISLLTMLVSYFLFYYLKSMKMASLLIAPYFLWLLIATSLNGYILFNN